MLSIIRKPHLRRATALLLALVLCLSPLGAIADTYDVSQGDVTVTAAGDTQTVAGFSVEKNNQVDQTDLDPVITGKSTGADANTVTITAEAGATANVTLDGLNIDTRKDPTDINTSGDAALTVSGEGTVNIELNGDSTLTSGRQHAGLEKQGDGKLVIGDDTGTDGSLTAQGGMEGAGIGGGFKSTGTDITITGGTVTAQGGSAGAGIGGGVDGDGKNITITGGTVTAQGKSAAGIGGGYSGNGTDITITGGTVTAQGGSYGAGIGGGNSSSGPDGNGDNIQIIGGTVIAVGGQEAAGIGGGVVAVGTGGNGTNITISGSAEVFVASGDQQYNGPAAAIGNGGKKNATESIEVEPDPAALNCDGSITYYPAGTTAEQIQNKEVEPIKTVCGHKAGTPQKENEKSATCTADGGYDLVTYCTECNEKLSSEHVKTDSALGHDLANHDAKAATCTEAGWEAYDTCSRCNYSTYKEIKAKGHALVHHEAQAATCTEAGWEAYDTCENCNYSTYKEIKAKGHALVHHEAKEATCTEVGWEAYDTCEKCDYSTYKEILAKGHSAGEPKEENRVEPTCTADGGYDLVTYCTACGEKLSTEHKTIEKTGHTPGEAVKENEVAAQVGVAGSYDEVIYCTACEAELSREKKTVPALDHVHTPGEAKKENEQAPTCTADGGYDLVTYCTGCGEKLTTEHKTIEKTGHTPGEAVREKEVSPQVGVAGSYDEVVYCTVCKEELSREKRTVDPLPEPEPEPTPVNVPDPFTAFCQSLAKRIRRAEQNETVQADASIWPGLQRVVFEALRDRPDVTLTLTCRLNGALTELTIPAGFDLLTKAADASMLTFEQIAKLLG